MIWLYRIPNTLWLLLALLMSATSVSFCQTVSKNTVLNSPVDKNTAIRFYYRNEENYFHFPLIFRAVDKKDPRLNTAPMTVEGRTAYVSLEEMRQLIHGLAHSDLSWQESEVVEAMQPFGQLPSSDRMEILVVSSKGTARAKLDTKRICATLKPLDSALRTPRALWEFQGFRLNYGCQIPGFNHEAFPDP